jgi:hypothetical protein
MLERLYAELGNLGRAASRPLDVAELRERIGRATSLAAELLDLAEADHRLDVQPESCGRKFERPWT